MRQLNLTASSARCETCKVARNAHQKQLAATPIHPCEHGPFRLRVSLNMDAATRSNQRPPSNPRDRTVERLCQRLFQIFCRLIAQRQHILVANANQKAQRHARSSPEQVWTVANNK